MDELVALVMEKTGLPKDQAKQAVETVIDFLKERLPDPIAGQVDAALENEATMDQAERLINGGAKRLGGLLNKKKG
jgi:nucleoid DNA-binding protein